MKLKESAGNSGPYQERKTMDLSYFSKRKKSNFLRFEEFRIADLCIVIF